jgi:hypothetical protein
MNPLHSLWSALIRAEHRFERALGLHPAPDEADGEEAGTSSGSSGATVELVPRAGNPATAERIRRLGELLQRFWPELSGESSPMPPQALELALAQAGLETVYGGGWSDKTAKGQGDMRGSNNYGARQCSPRDEGAGPWHCVAYGDSRPPKDAERAAGQTDNIAIPATFRFFDAGLGRTAEENGAYYFLRDLLKVWPVKAELMAGDAGRYAHRLGPDKANGGLYYFGGFGTSMAEREGSYVKAIASRLPEVAAGLGHDKVHATVPVLGEGRFYMPTSDVRIAGAEEWLAELGRALVRGEHAFERWLGVRPANDDATGAASPLAAVLGMDSGELSERRRRAVDILGEVVPSKYGDERFRRMAPGYRAEGQGSTLRTFEGDKELPAGFTTCGYLPGYMGARLGLAKNLSSYGTNALRDNAVAWGAWVTPQEKRLPKPGDAYAIEGPNGGIVHVGVFVRFNPDGSWHTADAGQGERHAQEARFVDRPFDADHHTLGGRPLAGWVDLDMVPAASDVRVAGADRDAPGAVLAGILGAA